MRYDFAVRTDIGLLRMENEDAVFAMPFPQEPKRFLAIVADGLGGYAGGKIASHLAVDVIRDVLNSYPDHGTIRPLLQKAFKEANAAILQKASQAGELRQMGTTATAIYFFEEKAYLAHVGDCRVYLLRGGRLSQCSNDHSFGRHNLSRALGLTDVKVDINILSIIPGDYYLVCSDGFTIPWIPKLSLKQLKICRLNMLPIISCRQRKIEMAVIISA